MMNKWLRENNYAAAILTLIRLYLGWQWMTAGWGKIVDGFSSKGFLMGAVGKATGEHPAVQGWWASFLESFAVPNSALFDFLVPWGEFLVGLGLLLGCFTTFAALMGLVMNFAFLFSGTVSTNPQMAILGVLVVAAGWNAGKFGLDYYVIPYLRKLGKKEAVNKTVLE